MGAKILKIPSKKLLLKHQKLDALQSFEEREETETEQNIPKNRKRENTHHVVNRLETQKSNNHQ